MNGSRTRRAWIVVVLVAGFAVVTRMNARGDGPLVLEKQGSFFVGGETVFSDQGLLGVPIPGFDLATSGNITVNQMYVQYQIPAGSGRNVPVAMFHGGTLTGKSYEETPDGRMGWYEYFARRRRPVYVADQTSRGRSGFDQTVINRAAKGLVPPREFPNILRMSPESSWVSFRIGPAFRVPFPDTKFPVDAMDEFAKQGVPDFNAVRSFELGSDPTLSNIVRLVRRMGSAILMGHSQAGFFPQRAALLDRTGVKGLISLEAVCATLTPDEIKSLTAIPMLFVYGDHTAGTSWEAWADGCRRFVDHVNRAGGKATLLLLPDAGLAGNSHMFMMDTNNLRVADLILRWIDRHVRR